MLEDYSVKPSTIDRIRGSWLAPQIESYLEWLEAHGYSRLVVYRRLPLLFHFAEFAEKKGCRDSASCRAYIKEFVSRWLEQHGAKAKTVVAVRKHAIDAECGVRQMLQLACNEPVIRNRRRRPFPFESAVPGKHQELASLGVEEREADFDGPETLQAAFRGVERLLLVSTDSLHAPDVRIKQHRADVQAAVGAGVEHVVYTSLPNAHPTEGPSIPDDHFWTEVALFESGLNWTILRNNLYAEVILRYAQFALKAGKLVSATQSQGRSYVSREDCARTAAAALLNAISKAICDVTGPASITHDEIASIISRLSGKSIRHVNVKPDEVEKGLVGLASLSSLRGVCVSWTGKRLAAITRS